MKQLLQSKKGMDFMFLVGIIFAIAVLAALAFFFGDKISLGSNAYSESMCVQQYLVKEDTYADTCACGPTTTTKSYVLRPVFTAQGKYGYELFKEEVKMLTEDDLRSIKNYLDVDLPGQKLILLSSAGPLLGSETPTKDRFCFTKEGKCSYEDFENDYLQIENDDFKTTCALTYTECQEQLLAECKIKQEGDSAEKDMTA